MSDSFVASATLVTKCSTRYKVAMPRKSMSRETLLPRLAEFVLQHGLSNASLRPLAKAAGTSDRMLLYHFKSKEDLLVELLAHLADDYAGLLDAVFGQGAAPSRRACVERIHSFSGKDGRRKRWIIQLHLLAWL